ncbi:MAG TPA: aminoglycoside adenylyltransferase domain-containing protein [Gemmatimonadaceae bacterium]|nr:aminoglycoside adenylyltransferase domain-containing protein [Gemmatimonadaceae bacterium]
MPHRLAATLRALTAALDQILGSSLVGAYLYGSLTQGAFDPARSDVDCIVVVRRDLTDAHFRALDAWLAQAAESDDWIRRLQMQFLVRGRLLRTDTRGALYQFGTLTRCGSDGNPIIWRNVLETGVTLIGLAPETFLPPITERAMFDALVREVAYLRAEITDPASRWRGQRFYRAYAVLTLCRILYTHRTGDVVSKRRAATWALRALPSRWHSLVRAAVASDRREASRLPLPRIARFIEFVQQQLVPPWRGT